MPFALSLHHSCMHFESRELPLVIALCILRPPHWVRDPPGSIPGVVQLSSSTLCILHAHDLAKNLLSPYRCAPPFPFSPFRPPNITFKFKFQISRIPRLVSDKWKNSKVRNDSCTKTKLVGLEPPIVPARCERGCERGKCRRSISDTAGASPPLLLARDWCVSATPFGRVVRLFT